MQIEARIKEKLLKAFSPRRLVIENDSAKHAGHAGAEESLNRGETHFTVTIVADGFAGRSRIDRHRMVHEVLAEELVGPVHALVVKAKAPDEDPHGA
jgi:BolA family transcriptional regulator, general stress-responsive regulator